MLHLTVIPEEPDDRWSLADWLEKMADANPGGPAVFGGKQMSATEVIRVHATRAGGLQGKVRSCLQQLLGYSRADNANYALLRPYVPVQHPKYPWLWADAASVQELGPLGNENFAGSAPGTFKPKVEGVGPDFFVGGAPFYLFPTHTSNYGAADITVRFSYYPWLVATDDDDFWAGFSAGEEWRRMCVCSERRPRLEFLVAEGTEQGKFYYCEQDATTDQPVAGPTGTPFSGGVYVRKQSNTITVCWKQVAEEYLQGEYDDDPSDKLTFPGLPRFDRYHGTVNTDEIWGQPAGTLLFADWWTDRYSQPVRVQDQDGVERPFGLIAHDVYMVFEKTDPPRAAFVKDSAGTVRGVNAGARFRGHQLAPFRPDVDKKWFGVTAGSDAVKGTLTGARKYEDLDFRDLFRHVNDPSYPIPD